MLSFFTVIAVFLLAAQVVCPFANISKTTIPSTKRGYGNTREQPLPRLFSQNDA